MVKISHYLRDSSLHIMITAPIIYSLLLPLLLLDLFIEVYHRICFPIDGIRYVQRRNDIIMNRHYLNGIEKVHCVYCRYATGFSPMFRKLRPVQSNTGAQSSMPNMPLPLMLAIITLSHMVMRRTIKLD